MRIEKTGPYRTRDGRRVAVDNVGAKYAHGHIDGIGPRCSWRLESGCFYVANCFGHDLVSEWSEPAIPAGWTAWHGGQIAPADWDGGSVLLRNGNVTDGNIVWRHDPPSNADLHPYDVIGYKRREEAPADDWKPDPRTIQACLEAIPFSSGYDARKAIEALLPAPVQPEKVDTFKVWIIKVKDQAGTVVGFDIFPMISKHRPDTIPATREVVASVLVDAGQFAEEGDRP